MITEEELTIAVEALRNAGLREGVVPLLILMEFDQEQSMFCMRTAAPGDLDKAAIIKLAAAAYEQYPEPHMVGVIKAAAQS